ncbi:hypothetical protein [Amycolatopsis dongchuanensis]|uniref:Transposase n=1 Tax=Amycolatopsis dongchuanensis TaxID=1070866 RepID=A0ABP9Q5K7_9PSEU
MTKPKTKTFDELPEWAQRCIRQLRKDVARYRTERNTLRAALEALLTKGPRADSAQTKTPQRNHR